MEHIIEKDFMYKGFRCVVIGTSMGHRCGYMGIPKGHKLYKVPYDKLDMDVHGGWTYSKGSLPVPQDAVDRWWLGFDCDHVGDKVDMQLLRDIHTEQRAQEIYGARSFWDDGTVKTTSFVEAELTNAVDVMVEEGE